MEPTNILSALFDLSFSEFITTRIIRTLYVLWMIAIGLFCVLVLIGSFNSSPAASIIALLVVCPLIFLLGTVMARVSLEMTIVLFRIAESTTAIAAQSRPPVPAPNPVPVPTMTDDPVHPAATWPQMQ